ncbi:MAG: flippase [bacterium]
MSRSLIKSFFLFSNSLLINNEFKKILKNFNWLAIEGIFNKLISFLATIYVAKYLGPDQFGLLNYSISYFTLISFIATLGLRRITIRELVLNNNRNEILGTTFFSQIIAGTICFLFILLSFNFLNKDHDSHILIIIISFTLFFQPFEVIDYFFQSNLSNSKIVKVKIISVFFVSSLKILFVLLNLPIIFFAASFTAIWLINAIGFISLAHKENINILDWKLDKKIALTLLKDSWPLILSAGMIQIYARVDQIMIKEILGNAELGYYSIAVRFTEAFYFIPTVIITTVFPKFIEYRKMNYSRYLNRLQQFYILISWISIFIGLIIFFSSNFIIDFLFGDIYDSSIDVLKIYIFSLYATSAGLASSQYLLAENYTRVSFYRTFLGMILNVFLNLLLIPLYGIEGAAWTTFISYLVATYSLLLFKKTRRQGIMLIKSIFFIKK